MKHLFVTGNQAFKLKELGYNEDCLGYFGKPMMGRQETISLHIDWCPESFPFSNELYCLAPIFDQVFTWFRNTHKLIGDITIVDSWDNWGYFISREDCMIIKIAEFYSNHEEARNACIDSLIYILEKRLYDELNRI